MIQITAHMRIFVSAVPLDFRTRIDGTAAVCRNVLGIDPLSGALIAFRNRAATMIRVLVFDGQGMWCMTKRISSGRFRFWCDQRDETSCQIAAHQLQALIAGGDFMRATAAETWRALR